VDYWKQHFSESPSLKAGWFHNYTCPQCAGQLVYDRTKPHEHACGHCGALAEETQAIAEAWTYARRHDISVSLFEAGVLYAAFGDPSDRDYILRVLERYAADYPDYEEYGMHAGRGKIMGQALDEAVWGCNALKALTLIGFDGDSEQGRRLRHRLFLPAARLTLGQNWSIHNIMLWHTAFAVGVALVFHDDVLLRQAYTFDLGARNQVLKGFTEDGIWYENSTGYHYYSLMAAANLLTFAMAYGREDDEVTGRVAGAYTAMLKLRFRNGAFPAFNDAQRDGPDVGVKGQLTAYRQAARLFAGTPYAKPILDAIAPYPPDGSLGDWLYGSDTATGASDTFDAGSVHLPSNLVAVLRNNQLEAMIKYGNLTASHAHADALGLSIPPWSMDLGTSVYGSPYHAGWYTRTAAHCAFIVDGQNQDPLARGVGEMSPDGSSFQARVDGAYPGVSASRALRLDGDTLRDVLTVSADAPRQIDWLFHAEGSAAFIGELSPSCLPESENGYQYFKNVRRVDGEFAAAFTMDGRTLRLRFTALPEGAAIYVMESPAYPADKAAHTILARVRARQAEFSAEYTAG
jgi:hypothetical protein